ncbi:hypothetical protein HON71_00855 [Candidatus Woesearchaeota archaeon]|nr:hypothetical protein [Candidatus Woesearchaeota archaeon]
MKTIKDYVDWIKKIDELDADLYEFSMRTLREKGQDVPEPSDLEKELYSSLDWKKSLIQAGLEHGTFYADCSYEQMREIIIKAGYVVKSEGTMELTGEKARDYDKVEVQQVFFENPFGGHELYLETRSEPMKTPAGTILDFPTVVVVRGGLMGLDTVAEPYKSQILRSRAPFDERGISDLGIGDTRLGFSTLLPFLEELVKSEVPTLLQERGGGMILESNYSISEDDFVDY